MRVRFEVPEDMKLVYQGGWHNVYCDGTHHLLTEGGVCGKEVDRKNAIAKQPIFKCDCEKYKS